MNDILKYLQHCEVTWKYQSFLVGKLICAGNIAMVDCLLKIDTCAKVPLGACETKDVIHKSPLSPAGHISEGVAFNLLPRKKQLQFKEFLRSPYNRRYYKSID